MGGFEAAGGAAQDEREHPGPWLWQGGPWGAAAGEGGRHLSRLEGTVEVHRHRAARAEDELVVGATLAVHVRDVHDLRILGGGLDE